MVDALSTWGTGGAGELPMVDALSTWGTGGAGELPIVDALSTSAEEGIGELPIAVTFAVILDEVVCAARELTTLRRETLASTTRSASVKDATCFFIRSSPC